MQLEACEAAIRAYVAEYLPDEELVRSILDCDVAFEQHRPWVAERRRKRGYWRRKSQLVESHVMLTLC